MPLFRYEALDQTGNTVSAYVQDADEQSVSQRLASMGYRPTRIEVAQRTLQAAPQGMQARHQPAAAPQTATAPVSRRTASERAIARMLHQLHIAFRAGMPAYQAVSTVAGQVHEAGLRQVLVEIAAGVRDGHRLSALMERYPRIFTRGDIGTLRAAEMAGFLPEAFEALANQHEQDDNTRRRLAIWVWFAHSGVVGLLLVIACASFFVAFRDFNPMTGFQAVGRTFMTVSLPLLVLYFGGLAYFARVRRSNGPLAQRWHRFLLRIPVVGKINFLRSNAVFTRMLQHLYHAGISGITAWETAANAVPNLYLSGRYQEGRSAVEATGRLSAGMQQVGVLEPADIGMVATGESTGDVPQALHYLASRYEEDTRVALGASVIRGAISFTLWAFALGALGMAIFMKSYFNQIFNAVEHWSQ